MKLKILVLLVILIGIASNVIAQTTTLSVGTQIAAGNVTQGTIKHPIYKFQLSHTGGGTVNLSGITFTTGGTYLSSDVTKFQLWTFTADTFNSATQLGSDITTGLGTGSHPLTFSNQTIPNNTTYYYWVTTDVAIGATTTGTLNVSAWNTSNFTVNGTKAGSATASGNQTITAFASLAADYFRSNGTGNWGTAGTWQSSHDNTNWATATLAPSSTANAITVRNGHTVTVAAAVSIDQTTVDTGGQVNVSSGITLTIANGTGTDMTVNGTLRNNAGTVTTTGALAFGSGGLYQHNYTTALGTIPTATWNANSTCEIVGYTSASGDLTFGQTFGHITWNCPNQTAAISANETLDTVNGNLTVSSTGSGSFVLGNADNITSVAGNLVISGGTFDMSANNDLVINLSGNFTMSGGTLTETNNNTATINFAGTAIQTLSITGTPTISEEINFNINSGATLEFENASTVLSGSVGTFTAASGSSMIIKHAGGIATTGATGCVRTTGTRSFSTGANYTYTGSTAQVTGTGLTRANNLTFSNTAGTTLSAALTTIAGACTINGGATLATNNFNMAFQGNFVNNGTFTAGSSNITIGAGTATQSIAGFTTTGTVSMTKTGGTATLTGNVSGGAFTLNGNGGTLNLGTGLIHAFSGTWTRTNGILNGGSSTLRLGGSVSGTGGTFTASTGTVEYNASGNQSVASLTYTNLIISNSGTKTLAAALTIGTTGTLTINVGATLATANLALIFQGNFVNSGTLTAGSSTVTISGTAATQNIGSFTTTGLVSMTKTAGTATFTGNASGGGLTINGTGGTLNLGTGLTHTFTGTWTRTAGTLDGGSSTLRLGAGFSGTGGTFTANTGTVVYYASGTQTIAAVAYNNLTLSGTSAKTITGATVNGVFSIEGTATTTGTVLTYGASATLRYNGSGTQTVGIEWPASFARNITIVNINGVTLDASKTPYTGTLTNNGKLNCISYQLSGTVNNNGIITAAIANIMNSGTLTNNTGSTIEYTSPLTIPASTGYYNLTLSATGTYLLGGNVTGINMLTLSTATTYLHPSGYTLGYTTLTGSGSILSTAYISLASNNPAVAAGGLMAGSSNNVFYAFSTAVNTSSATLNSVAFTTAGTAVTTTDLTNFKLWYSTSNVFSGASQLGSTMTTGLSAGTHTFSGLSQVIADGTTGYYWITANLASGATAGRTLQVTPAITTANLTFASGTKTGTAYAGGLQTIATIFCTTTDYAVPAMNVAISQTKAPLYKFTLANTSASSINFTGLSFITGGSYVAADINKYQLWTNTTDNLGGALQVGANLTTVLGVGSHSFASFTQALSAGSTIYFWITTDFTASAVIDNVIGVAALTASNITLSAGSLTVTAYSGGAQRIISSQVTLRSANTALPAANVGQATTKYPIYRFTVSTNEPVGSVTLSAASFTTAGTYQSTDVSKFQLWSSATDQLDDAVQLGSDITTTLGTVSHTFSSLSQAITAGSTRFFWITTDIPLTAVTGRTINVSAMTTSDITVSSGTKGGTAYASSAQTITSKGWDYTKRQPIAQLSGAGTGYQIKYIVNYGNGTDSGQTVYLNSNCRTDFGDVRFYNGTTELKYWMESMTSGSTATFWVKLAGDLSAGSVNVDINYGNSSALTTSNGLNTFMVFDDFGSDLTKWIKYKYIEGSTITIPSGQSYARFGGGIPSGTYGHSVAGSNPGYSGFQNNIVEYRYRVGDDAIGEVSVRSKFEYSTGTVVAGKGYKARSDQRVGEGQSIHKPPFYGWEFVGGTGDGLIPVVDQWYRGTFTAFGNDLKFYRDGTLMRSITDTEFPNTGEITLQNHYGLAGGSYTDYDWVFVRKNAGADPTYSAWMYPNHYYRTINSGDWSDMAIWESSPDNTNWSAATMAPDQLSMGILIRNSHTVTVSASLTADQLVVNSGGKLIINNGITFDVNDGTGTDVTMNGTLTTLGNGILSGSGSFTLGAGAYLETQNTEGVSTTASTGCIQVTGTLTLDNTANYTFNGTSAQVTGNAIDTANDFTLNNSAGLTFTNAITIDGILYQTQGDINSVNTDYVDGYESENYNHLRFPETGYNISGWSIDMTNPNLFPNRIDRQWIFTGSYSNDKVVTFYWTTTDDQNYTWTTADPPAVYLGATKLTTTSWSDAIPRQITVTVNGSFGAKGTYTIGRDNDQTLPIELSSFTALISSTNYVQLTWITQSETNVAGFRIYRNTSDDLETAVMLNTFVNATNTSQTQVYVYTDEEIQSDGTYYYWLQNLDLDGSFTFHGPTTITINGHEQGIPPVPVVLGINNAYPNPFNPSLTVKYGMTKSGNAELTIFNQRGQLVRNLYSGNREIGSYSLVWDGRDNSGRELPSGVYLIRLQTPGKAFSHKVVLLK